MNINDEFRPPVPPFTRETTMQKVRMDEGAWNSCDPQRVVLERSTVSGAVGSNFRKAGRKSSGF